MKEFKRLETYVGWTCNQKCTYCMEYENMEEAWNKRITKIDIFKTLMKYKKSWYNHVTYLGWEPFIQPVFLDALRLWKKFGFTILVTTNATTLHIQKQAEKFLPYIDELFLSVQAIWIDDQQKMSRTHNFVHWDMVFENINKYWTWTFLKANIVITQDNLSRLYEIVRYLCNKWVRHIAITYPDIAFKYYGKKHILEKVAPSYQECISKLHWVIQYCQEYHIQLKIPDFPFCTLPEEKRQEYIKLTDDYDYQTRIKISHTGNILDRWDLSDYQNLPRKRKHIDSCESCKYKSKCWWPSIWYEELYWLSEINPIIL